MYKNTYTCASFLNFIYLFVDSISTIFASFFYVYLVLLIFMCFSFISIPLLWTLLCSSILINIIIRHTHTKVSLLHIRIYSQCVFWCFDRNKHDDSMYLVNVTSKYDQQKQRKGLYSNEIDQASY